MVRRLTQTPRTDHALTEPQSKARIEFSAVVRAATGETRDCAAHRGELAEIRDDNSGSDRRTARRTFADRKRQIVTALLIGDSQIAASLAPFGAMRQKSSDGRRETEREYAPAHAAACDRFRPDAPTAADLAK